MLGRSDKYTGDWAGNVYYDLPMKILARMAFVGGWLLALRGRESFAGRPRRNCYSRSAGRMAGAGSATVWNSPLDSSEELK